MAKENRDSKLQEIDPNYEFDAPKFKDLTKVNDNYKYEKIS